MNKRPNPFQPAYPPAPPPPQASAYPPLPPGPPPPVNQHQQEWAAYWAAQQQNVARAPVPVNAPYPPAGWPQQPQQQQQQQQQQPPPPTGPAPPAYDPNLYRNYGYGGQNPAVWQQQPQPQPPTHPVPYPQAAYPQQQQQQYVQQPAYPAYHPQQPIPIAGPPQQQPVAYGPQYPYPAPPPQMQQQMAPRPPAPQMPPPPPPPPPPQQQQQHQHQHQQHTHTPPHHFPPAKRPRFDSATANIPARPPAPTGPGGNQKQGPNQSGQRQPMPPPLHFKPGGGMVPASQLNNSGAPTGPKFPVPNGPAGGGRSGGVSLGVSGGGRGGGPAGRGGRGGAMGGGRGGGRGGGPGLHGGSMGGGGGRGGSGGAPSNFGGRGGSMGGSGRQAPRGPASFRSSNSSRHFNSNNNNNSASSSSSRAPFHPPTGPSRGSEHHNHYSNAHHRRDRSRDRSVVSDSSPARSSSGAGLPTSAFNFSIRKPSPFPSFTGRRTLTDFRIIGFGVTPVSREDTDETAAEEESLDWSWGAIPGGGGVATKRARSKTLSDVDEAEDEEAAASILLEKTSKPGASPKKHEPEACKQEKGVDAITVKVEAKEASVNDPPTALALTPSKTATSSSSRPEMFKLSSTNSVPVAPRNRHFNGTYGNAKAETSRIRIYFQSPPELEEIKPQPPPIGPVASWGAGSNAVAPIHGRGKRKKDENDEDDEERAAEGGGKRKKEDDGGDEHQHHETANGIKVEDGGAASFAIPLVGPTSTQEQDDPAGSSVSEPAPISGDAQGNATTSVTDLAFLAQMSTDPQESQDADADADAEGEVHDSLYDDLDADGQYEDVTDGLDDWQQDDNANMTWTVEGQTPAEDYDGGAGADPSGVDPISFPNADSHTTVVNSTAGEIMEPITSEATTESSSPVMHSANFASAKECSVVSASAMEAASTIVDSGSVTSPSSIREASISGDATLGHTGKTGSGLTTGGTGTTARNTEIPLKEEQDPLPSPNRISISYAGSMRRLVLDADVVESVKIKRGQGKIEVIMFVQRDLNAATDGAHELVNAGHATEGQDIGASVDEAVNGVLGEDAATVSTSGNDVNGGGVEAAWRVEARKKEDGVGLSGATKPDEVQTGTVRDGTTSSQLSPLSLVQGSARRKGELFGILVDALDESTQTYRSVSVATSETDPTIPPFHKYLSPLSLTKEQRVKVRLTLHLDKDKPLSEPKWVKTGDIEEWLKSIASGPGPNNSNTSAREYGTWSGKITIIDPDPPATLFTLIDAWAQHSTVGPPKERIRFVAEHIKAGPFDNTLEILLRLVRGDRSGLPMQVYGSSLTSALSENAFHAAQQTHVSLAVLAMFRLTGEYAEAAGEESKAVEHRLGEIMRALPVHLVNKSLDFIFKDWWAAERRNGGSSTRG